MARRLSPAAAVALAALALGLGAAACGGGGQSAEDRVAERQALTRWETVLTRWREDMLGALNGISLLLSDGETVDLLQQGDALTTAKLSGFEERLSRCRVTIVRLGSAPDALVSVRATALRACRSLEKGARLLREDFSTWRAGPGGPATSGATESLSDGQRGVEHVQVTLKAALVSGRASS